MKVEELRIKPSELRLGNWVTYDNRYFQISMIADVFPELNTTEFGIGVVDYNNIQPIPLSEEVLLKCPEIQPSTWMSEMWTIRDPKSQFHIVKMKGRFVFRGLGMSIVYVDTLHHLQNLVYMVTGEELEINLLL